MFLWHIMRAKREYWAIKMGDFKGLRGTDGWVNIPQGGSVEQPFALARCGLGITRDFREVGGLSICFCTLF